jgi:hypothetical protein
MFFEVEHIFDAPVEAVEAAMFHPDYYAFLEQQKDVLDGVSPREQEDSGGHIKRRMHYKPRPAFDHIGPKKVPAHWFEFIEESTWDKATRKLVFDNVPVTDKVARRFVNHGEILLERLTPTRTRRRARAELRLHNLPLMLRPLAGLAEQMIAREAKKLIENEARALGEFLEAGKSVRPNAETAI